MQAARFKISQKSKKITPRKANTIHLSRTMAPKRCLSKHSKDDTRMVEVFLDGTIFEAGISVDLAHRAAEFLNEGLTQVFIPDLPRKKDPGLLLSIAILRCSTGKKWLQMCTWGVLGKVALELQWTLYDENQKILLGPKRQAVKASDMTSFTSMRGSHNVEYKILSLAGINGPLAIQKNLEPRLRKESYDSSPTLMYNEE